MPESLSKISVSKVAAILGILVPFFYAFGYFYDLGYLSEYGLSNEYFTRSHQEYLFKFYYVILSTLTGFFLLKVGYIFYILFLIFTGLLLFLLLEEEAKKKNEVPRFITNFIQKMNLKDSTIKRIKLIVKAIITISLGMLALYLLATVLSILVLPMLKGQKDARTEMLNYVECIEGSPHQQNCTYIYRNKEKILSGLLIAKSDKHIAIWNGKKSIVYPIKDEIIVIEMANKQSKKSDNK